MSVHLTSQKIESKINCTEISSKKMSVFCSSPVFGINSQRKNQGKSPDNPVIISVQTITFKKIISN